MLQALKIQEHTIRFTLTTDSIQLELSDFEVKNDQQNVIMIMTSLNNNQLMQSQYNIY